MLKFQAPWHRAGHRGAGTGTGALGVGWLGGGQGRHGAPRCLSLNGGGVWGGGVWVAASCEVSVSRVL